MADQGQNQNHPPAGPTATGGGERSGDIALDDLLRNLFDFEMREIVTTRMLPLIYRFAVVSMGALVVPGVVTAFIQSVWMGLA